LQAVIEELISQNQCAFIKRRPISDNTILAHERIRHFHQKIGRRACLKIDLQKAFENINREFLMGRQVELISLFSWFNS